MPLHFRGRSLAYPKSFVEGTQRSRSPEQTLALIEPLYARVGLTRLADITGLDRIGIPVVVGIRPNAASIVCSAGKGLTRAAAEVSAAMESIEAYYAETARPEGFVDSYRGAQGRVAMIPLERLSLWQPSLFGPDRPEHWALGWDLIGQEEVAVPLVQVLLHGFAYDPLKYLSFAPLGSNGLASGNNLAEAICSGLYEVIERDALTCTSPSVHADRVCPSRVDLDQCGPWVQRLREQLAAAQFGLVLMDRSVDTGVPVYHAVIFDRSGPGQVAAGFGAHLDPHIAQVRAITEAVQSRAVLIAGARDDLFRHRRQELDRVEAAATFARLQSLPLQLPAAINQAGENFEDDLQVLLVRLASLEMRQVIVFELSEADCPISVVRVLVPGLEGYLSDYTTPGQRAKSWHS